MTMFDFKSPQLMFTGLLIRVNVKEAGLNRKTGESVPPRADIQLMCNIASSYDDSIRSDMANLSLKDVDLFGAYQALQGQVISVPVGFMKTKEGGVVFWALKGYPPQLVKPDIVSTGNNAAASIKSPLDKN